jgi:hypothetical protein
LSMPKASFSSNQYGPGVSQQPSLVAASDQQGNLWIGLDEGLAVLGARSNLSYLTRSPDLPAWYYRLPGTGGVCTWAPRRDFLPRTPRVFLVRYRVGASKRVFREANGALLAAHFKGLFEVTPRGVQRVPATTPTCGIFSLTPAIPRSCWPALTIMD